MASYTRTEAREWARERLVGAVNCTIPSFTADLRGINQAGIRHDVRLAKEHGFLGTLGVSEVSITLPEYLDFLRIVRGILLKGNDFADIRMDVGAIALFFLGATVIALNRYRQTLD